MANIKGGLAVPSGGGSDCFTAKDSSSSSSGNNDLLFTGFDPKTLLPSGSITPRRLKRAAAASLMWTICLRVSVFLLAFCVGRLLVRIAVGGVPTWMFGSSSQTVALNRLESQLRTLESRVKRLEQKQLPNNSGTTNYHHITTTQLSDVDKKKILDEFNNKQNQPKTKSTFGDSIKVYPPTKPPVATDSLRKKTLGPMDIDYSGLLSNPLEVQAVQDLEELLGQSLEMTVRKHADFSKQGIQIQQKHVTQISIRGYGLTSLPKSLGNLSYLEYLGLDDNQLTTLPDIFDKLPRLKQINLHGNPLTALPPTLQHMTRPIQLNLVK